MWVALLCVLLVACGPVILGEEERAPVVDPNGDAGATLDPPSSRDAAATPTASGQAGDGGMPPMVTVRIRPVDCGKCFELQAEGAGGQPPYEFEWEDGSRRAQRIVCVEVANTVLSVLAIDAEHSRSALQTIQLEGNVDANCQEPMDPADAGTAAGLCLENPSFEITATSDQEFAAAPWSPCTNPAADNTPMIGNQTNAVTPGVPEPVDGLTFLALIEGQQVSQALCSQPTPGVPLNLELDVSGVAGGGVSPDTEQVFLEIYGGLSVDCSQREMLWASPALHEGWQRFCVTLRPQSFMTQITLRANTDLTSLSPAYLLVDNLRPVESCP